MLINISRKVFAILLMIALIACIITILRDPKRIDQFQNALRQAFQTDEGEFKKYFGFEPNQPTSELHAIVQARVLQKTQALWCIWDYVNWQGWDGEAPFQYQIADRATRLAKKFGYEPWDSFPFPFQENPFDSCPPPYKEALKNRLRAQEEK